MANIMTIVPELTRPDYDLDPETRALLRYASKLTETPSFVTAKDIAALKEGGWDGAGDLGDHGTDLVFQFQRPPGGSLGPTTR